LKHDPCRPRSHGFRCQQGRQVLREFFFQAACICGSLLG
jgi:hypothetical protein